MKRIFAKWLVAGAALVLAGCPDPNAGGELPFVAVANIIDVPDTAVAGQDLALTGTVEPAAASNRTIGWSVNDAGTTYAVIEDGTLKTGAPGTVIVTAAIVNGQAVSVDYTRNFTITVRPNLAGVITEANAAKTGVLVSADGSDVAQDSQWTTQAALDALNAEIASAETVSQDPAASLTATDDAIAALTQATAAFNAAKQNGTKAGADPAPDKTALAAAINTANAAKNNVAMSPDGSDVAQDSQWTTQAALDTLNTEIASAETVSQDPAASLTAINNAASALTQATAAFNAAKQNGTKVVSDKTALAAAIADANAAKNNVAVSADGSDVSADAYWASQTVLDTLDAAIASAETVSLDPAASQSAVDAAASALTAATGVFNKAIRKGTRPVTLRTVSLGNGPSFNLRLVNPPGPGGFKYDSGITSIATISKGYWMGETEVTQELFEAVMSTNPAYFKTAAAGENRNKLPVESINWYAAIAFCNKLSLLDGKTPVYSVKVNGVEVDWANLAYTDIPGLHTGNNDWNQAVKRNVNGYRLPYEMEWMWAAMGGSEGGPTVTSAGYAKPFAGSNGTNSIGDYAWHSGNSASKTRETGKKLPNELGLYDMAGNVAEWCQEEEGKTVLARHAKPDEPARMYRGGGWSSASSICAVGYRGEEAHEHPSQSFRYVGFRVACDK